MSLHYYVPGGAGYIGSVLTETLLSEGQKVTVLDNLMYGQTSLLHLASHKNFNFIKGDFRDSSARKHGLRNADVVIPLAAIVGAPACDRSPELAKGINLTAALEFFGEVSSQQMLIMPTTNSAYGSGDQNNYCDEKSPLHPISEYAKMKVLVEQALLSKPNTISFRLATVFGLSPRMRLDLLVNDFAFRARRDKEILLFEAHFKRNYIHVRDVVRAFLHGISNFEAMKGNIYNVGLSSANLSKHELCLEIQRLLPDFKFSEDAQGRDPDQRNYIVSNEKIEKTGFLPQKKISDGVQEIFHAFDLLDGQKMRNY
jgi:nucleoside-diphosphate-sugar epimerase